MPDAPSHLGNSRQSLRERVADELANNDACGAGPVGPQEYADDAAAILRLLLADDVIEALWKTLPLQRYCDCEERWDDDLECFTTDEEACDRRTIVCVRNCIASLIGEAQVPAA